MTTQSETAAPSSADILVTESDAPLQVHEGERSIVAMPESEKELLALADVLHEGGSDPSPGAYLTLESIGEDTVVTMDSAVTSRGPVQIVTLEGVTGMTLQQLLSDCPGVT